jgi:selenocysteine-specific elongation factor
LVFDSPVTAPRDALVIGSRLDTDIRARIMGRSGLHNADCAADVNQCRLAFHGRVAAVHDSQTDATATLRVYKPKQRLGSVDRVTDDFTVIAQGMFKKETNISLFVGLVVQRDSGAQTPLVCHPVLNSAIQVNRV